MSFRTLVLADRLVLPFREASITSPKHPLVQLGLHTQELPSSPHPTFVLVGFRKDEIVGHFHDFLYIVNPEPSAIRKSKDILHALKLIHTKSDLLIIESNASFPKGRIDEIVARNQSQIFESVNTNDPEGSTFNFFIKADDLYFVETCLATEDSFERALRSMLSRFPLHRKSTGSSALPAEGTLERQISPLLVFDQQ